MRYSSLIGAVVGVVCLSCVNNGYAKSVFAVASHGSSKIKAYQIDGDVINPQATVEDIENFGNGATGLCVWADLELMFVTYESSEMIAWASTKTLTREGDDEIAAPEGSLAGVVADETNGVLYVVTRSDGHLYTYTFDQAADTLVLIHPNDPAYPGRKYRQLEGLESGATYGLALDEDGGEPVSGIPTGLLYVADGTETVRYYNTMTWQFVDSVEMERDAVGIDVDGNRYLYAGGYFGSPAHTYLLRYDLLGDPNDPETSLEKDVGARVTDISVDRDTGLIYTTTHRVVNGRIGAVEVYDWVSADPNTLVLTDIESDVDFAGPAGIAVGPLYKYPRMFVEKVDDVDELSESVLPGDEITYSIVVRTGVLDETNVVVTDRLPLGVDFVSAVPNDGYYDADAHAYVWELGDLPGYDPDPNDPSDPNVYLALTVQVNDLAEPAADLVNIVQVESDEAYTEAEALTPVGCWGGDIIFVGQFAAGARTGVDWANAHTDLQDALARAGKGCGNEIWVAEGTYKPSNNDVTVSFDMVPDVGIYGGFNATETQRNQRNWKIYDSILSGNISDLKSNKIVTGIDYLGDAVLDGFTIKKGKTGVYCENTWDPNDLHEPDFVNCTIFDNDNYGIQFYDYADALIDNCTILGNQGDGFNLDENCWPVIENCIIRDNYGKGVSCADSHLEMTDSTIEDNNNDGLFFSGSVPEVNSCTIAGNKNGIYGEFSTVTVENSIIKSNSNNGVKSNSYNDLIIANCIIYLNGDNGIYCSENSEVAQIYNNCIHHNGLDGINTSDTNEYADVRNNTVVYNDGYGIACDNGRSPDVSNCIIWGNDSGDVYGSSPVYSCFDNGTSGTGNLSVDPDFAYSNPNLYNYHLSPDSLCIDAGVNTDVEIDETDIDADDRIYNGDVDMGADEYTCSDVSNPADFDADGLVNMTDLGIFAAAWLSHNPNEPDLADPDLSDPWNPVCNLDAAGNSQYTIDPADLALLMDEWLWTACWKNTTDCGDDYNVLDYDGDGLVNMVEFSLFASFWQTYQPSSPDWHFCNLDATGNSQYTIDLADLMLLMDDWLWVSCARADEFPPAQQSQTTAEPNEPEPTALEQALKLNENICFLSDLWQNDPDMQEKTDPNDWQDFMDTLCIELDNLIGSLDDIELMAYNLIAGENCCDQQQAASASSGGMLLSTTEVDAAESTLVEADISTAPVKQLPLETQITLAKQYVALEDMVEYLEKIWLEDPHIQQKINAADWWDFMDAVGTKLLELQVLFEPEVKY